MKTIHTILIATLIASPLCSEDITINEQRKDNAVTKYGQEESALKRQGYYDTSKYSNRPYQNYDSHNNYGDRFGDSSRYSTSQGWSRGYTGWWWGRYNDMPSSGYSSTTSRK